MDAHYFMIVSDYQQKSPSAVDYFDFAELAEDTQGQVINENKYLEISFCFYIRNFYYTKFIFLECEF